MIETGGINFSNRVNNIISSSLSSEDFHRELIEITRNISHYPVWDKYNFYKFLHFLHRINLSLSIDRQIELSTLDVPFSWDNPTLNSTSSYWDFYHSTMPLRDSIMGQNAINLGLWYRRIIFIWSHRTGTVESQNHLPVWREKYQHPADKPGEFQYNPVPALELEWKKKKGLILHDKKNG